VRILVVEDDRRMAALLDQGLTEEGHHVVLAHDGQDGLTIAMSASFDAIVLDVMLPRLDGLQVARRLRKQANQTPVLMLTARDGLSDIVKGLDLGADDYLTKPFALDVLLAKVRAAARRVPVRDPAPLHFEDLVLRPHRYELQRGARVASLTRTECALLAVLIRRAKSVVPHAVLIEEGWGGEGDVSYDSLYVFIRALRSKITYPGEPELLHTIRGVGYSLRN
jgi:DNA-binding response OmpR family regulator